MLHLLPCCTHCAPWVYYCDQCFAEAHSKINLFHIGEVWEVGLLLIAKLYHSYLSNLHVRMECTNPSGGLNKWLTLAGGMLVQSLLLFIFIVWTRVVL